LGIQKGAIRLMDNGQQYAGTHLFIDMWGASHTSNEEAGGG